MFTRHDLESLIAIEGGPIVSIFQPNHPAGRELRQDPIRFRKLLGDAHDALARAGLRRPAIDAQLAPGDRLLRDEEFWRHLDRGLAVFLAPNMFRIHRLPTAVREQLVVAPRVHVTPLFNLVEPEAAFLVLTITAARARLFEGTRDRWIERTDVKLPAGRTAVERETDYQETRHAPPVGRPHAPTPRIATTSQVFGDTPESVHKAELIEFLHRLVAALDARMRARTDPLVVAAQPDIQGQFRGMVDWRNLIAEPITDNPDGLDARTLHAKAWALIQPRVAAGPAGDLDRLNALLGSADARATLRVEEIVPAACYRRVDTLFVAEGEVVWGRFDPAAGQVVVHGDPLAGDEDLLDYAAIETLRHRGHVDVMPKTALREWPAAAIFRY